MIDTVPAGEEIYLQPGEVWFGRAPARVRTLLGSCVAITLWHPQRGLGGMCHYMLPERPPERGGEPDGRYAPDAMQLLLHAIVRHGARPADFEAKLFGGGRMFNAQAELSGPGAVQARNVQVARELVRRHGMPIRAEHLGGHGHRLLVFDLADGAAWLKHTPLQTDDTTWGPP